MFFSYSQLSGILGIAQPLLMLDEATLNDDGVSASGRKMVSVSEPHFIGHFPAQPIMPGVLQVAAMAQLAKLIFQHTVPCIGGATIVLKKLRRIKFRKPVFPGVVLNVKCEIVGQNEEHDVEFKVSCSTDDGVACAGTIVMGNLTEEETVPPEHSLPPFLAEMNSMEYSSVTDLMQILPHRPPFLLLDGAFGLKNADGVAYGVKNITGNDVLLANSLSPNRFPAYLLIEAAAQLGCAQALERPEHQGKLGIFMAIDEALFQCGVFPGDRLLFRISTDCAGQGGFAAAQCWNEKQLVASCQLKFIISESI